MLSSWAIATLDGDRQTDRQTLEIGSLTLWLIDGRTPVMASDPSDCLNLVISFLGNCAFWGEIYHKFRWIFWSFSSKKFWKFVNNSHFWRNFWPYSREILTALPWWCLTRLTACLEIGMHGEKKWICLSHSWEIVLFEGNLCNLEVKYNI